MMNSSTLSSVVTSIYHYAPWISVIMVIALALVYVIHSVYFDFNACEETFKEGPSNKCLKKKTVSQYSNGVIQLGNAMRSAIQKFDLFADKKQKETKENYDVDVEKREDDTTQDDAPPDDITKDDTAQSLSSKQPKTELTMETFEDGTCYTNVDSARKLYTAGPEYLLKAYNELRKQVNTGVDGLLTLKKTEKNIERKEKKRKDESEKTNADISKAGDERKEADAKKYGMNKSELDNDKTFDKPSVSY